MKIISAIVSHFFDNYIILSIYSVNGNRSCPGGLQVGLVDETNVELVDIGKIDTLFRELLQIDCPRRFFMGGLLRMSVL